MPQSFLDAIADAKERRHAKAEPPQPVEETAVVAEPELTTFQQNLAKLRAKRAAEEAAKPAPTPHNLEDLDLADSTPPKTEWARQLDELKVRVKADIIGAYNRWSGKPAVQGGRTETYISCPIPGHADNKRSASINEGKQTGICYACDEGFDAWTIAGWHHGIPAERFNELVERVATEDFGMTKPKPVLTVVRNDPEPEPVATVTELSVEPIQLARQPRVDVAGLTPPNDNFLASYCRATNQDDIAEIFNLACGLLAVSCVVGHRMKIRDSHDVAGNIALILTGHTGAGKTRATRHMINVLRAAVGEAVGFPYQTGNVRIIKDPGSDEYLVDEHIMNEGHTSVKSLIQYGELNKLMSQSRRHGSTILARLFEFLDTESHIETGSRGSGKKIARNAFASFVSTTQPDLLQKIFSAEDVAFGAGNRLQFVYGNEVEADLMADNAAIVDLKPAQVRLLKLDMWLGRIATDSTPLFLEWGVGTREQLNLWGKNWLRPLQRRSNSALLNRADLHAKKYILLFAANDQTTVITPDHVTRATQFVEFLCQCYALVDERIGRTEGMEHTDRILEVIDEIVASGKAPTERAIFHRLRRKIDARQLKSILDALAGLGVIKDTQSDNKRGPKTTTFTRPSGS